MPVSLDVAKRVHRGLVANGDLLAARIILRGMAHGCVRMDLSEASFTAETALEHAGAFVRSSYDGRTATCRVERYVV